MSAIGERPEAVQHWGRTLAILATLGILIAAGAITWSLTRGLGGEPCPTPHSTVVVASPGTGVSAGLTNGSAYTFSVLPNSGGCAGTLSSPFLSGWVSFSACVSPPCSGNVSLYTPSNWTNVTGGGGASTVGTVYPITGNESFYTHTLGKSGPHPLVAVLWSGHRCTVKAQVSFNWYA